MAGSDRPSIRHDRPDRPSIHKITDKKQGPPFDDPVTPLTTWLTSFCKGNQIKQKSKGHTHHRLTVFQITNVLQYKQRSTT